MEKLLIGVVIVAVAGVILLAAAINPPVQLSAVAIIQWRARSC
jgi:hypothetical protein